MNNNTDYDYMNNNNTDYDYMIEILTALKGGKTIQVRRIKEWYDIDIKIENYIPKFNDYEYRIKPDARNYRVAILTEYGDRYPVIVYSEEFGSHIQSDPRFVCWHTDWMDY